MAKNPRERYASTRDLLMDLQSVRKGEPPALARQLVDRGGPAALADLEEGEEVSPQAAQAIAEGKAIPEALRETRQGQGQTPHRQPPAEEEESEAIQDSPLNADEISDCGFGIGDSRQSVRSARGEETKPRRAFV